MNSTNVIVPPLRKGLDCGFDLWGSVNVDYALGASVRGAVKVWKHEVEGKSRIKG